MNMYVELSHLVIEAHRRWSVDVGKVVRCPYCRDQLRLFPQEYPVCRLGDELEREIDLLDDAVSILENDGE